MVENISTAFRCNVCNKNYKDKTGLWYHNKKYHVHKSSNESLKTSDKENKSSWNAFESGIHLCGLNLTD